MAIWRDISYVFLGLAFFHFVATLALRFIGPVFPSSEETILFDLKDLAEITVLLLFAISCAVIDIGDKLRK